MTRTAIACVVCVTMWSAGAAAQTPVPQPTPAPALPPKLAVPPPQTPPAPQPAQPPKQSQREERTSQPVNIRIDVAIVDEGGPQASRKTISVTLRDQQQGQVRAAVSVPGVGHVPVALDALPIMERDGRIHLRITLEYRPSPKLDPKEPIPADMRLSFAVLLQSGQTIEAAQAADPVTDRQVSVEVTATILK